MNRPVRDPHAGWCGGRSEKPPPTRSKENNRVKRLQFVGLEDVGVLGTSDRPTPFYSQIDDGGSTVGNGIVSKTYRF